MKAATAPRRNAGAAAYEMTCDSLTVGVSESIRSGLWLPRKKGRPLSPA
jgi:hypothetical protein